MKNDVYQSNLVRASRISDIETYCYNAGKKILGIQEARPDDMRPDKPIIDLVTV